MLRASGCSSTKIFLVQPRQPVFGLLALALESSLSDDPLQGELGSHRRESLLQRVLGGFRSLDAKLRLGPAREALQPFFDLSHSRPLYGEHGDFRVPDD